jgi:hypothetical protein
VRRDGELDAMDADFFWRNFSFDGSLKRFDELGN